MTLTQEQQEYIVKHLREPQKTYAICSIAKMIAQNNNDINLNPEDTELAALIMNIGETNDVMTPNGVSIYSKEYGPWDEKAKELNSNRGQISIDMAEEQGIKLSQNARDAIISTSKGGTLNKLAITLKLAQTMEAIRHTRWSRGQEKQPAKDIAEVIKILNEELDFMLKGQQISEESKNEIKVSMIRSAKKTYIQEKHVMVQNLIRNIVWNTNRELDMSPDVAKHIGSTTLTEDSINELLGKIPEDRIDDFCYELKKIVDMPAQTALRHEDMVCNFIDSWEKEEKIIKKEDIGLNEY